MNLEAYLGSSDMILFTTSVAPENLEAIIARGALYAEDGKTFRHIALTLPPEKDRRYLRG